MAALEEEDKEPEAPTFSWMPADCVPMADGEYDAIVMGTGLKECIMSGLLSTMGKKARRRRPDFFFPVSARRGGGARPRRFPGGRAAPPREPDRNSAALGRRVSPPFRKPTRSRAPPREPERNNAAPGGYAFLPPL